MTVYKAVSHVTLLRMREPFPAPTLSKIKENYFQFSPRIFMIPVYTNRPPLWSSDQSSWLQIQRSEVRFPALPDILRSSGSGTVSTQPRELLGGNSSGFGLENREHGRGDLLRWPRDTLYPQKLALISPTYGGGSVGIVRLRTKTTEFLFVYTNNT
jgi:hypothetical protein